MAIYEEILPAPRLLRYVECYWTRRDSQGSPGHQVLPDGCADILFAARGFKKLEPTGVTLVGLMTTPQVVDIPAKQLLFGIRFRPGMAAAFIPEASKLNDRNEPLENILGSTAGQLLEQFGESETPAAMATLMDTFLRPLRPPDAGQRALQQLSFDSNSVDQVATDAGLSTRQFRRLCLERAGVSPKYLSRILRFRKTTKLISTILAKRAQPNWAQLAAACGYHDQAHFIREFQEFTGQTPGRYLQSFAARRS